MRRPWPTLGRSATKKKNQDHLTVFTASGSIHPSRCQLGSRMSLVSTHPWHHPAATWVNTTRCCKYSQVVLMMGENIIFPLNGIMLYPCICLIACHIHGTMYRVASICFCISQRCTSHRTMYMTCYKTYTWIRHDSVKGEYGTWFCNITLLTSQFTFDTVAILYWRDLTVPHHAQHCDGQWLILDRHCLP